MKCLPSIAGLVFLLLLGAAAGDASAVTQGQLEPGDCIKCHRFQSARIAEAGSRHATAVGCMDCHPGHPPGTGEIFVGCGSCHAGQPHDEIGHCLHCHTDPHRPLASLRDPLKPARKECLSCHAPVGELMAASPSRHAELFCNRCHDQHKRIPDCLDCHQEHLTRQNEEDCARCHSAHQPMLIVPAGHIPERFCRPCHVKQADELATTRTNHGGINCDYCHKGPHPSTPRCQDCHGFPHSQNIHSRFRDCLECHRDAHNLLSNR